jgi:hypothetical protein
MELRWRAGVCGTFRSPKAEVSKKRGVGGRARFLGMGANFSGNGAKRTCLRVRGGEGVGTGVRAEGAGGRRIADQSA